MTSGQVVLAGLGLFVASVLGMFALPPTDGGAWLVLTAAVGLFGTPFAYILARGMESDRRARETIEQFCRGRGFRPTDPPAAEDLPEQCYFRRQGYPLRPFDGPAFEMTLHGRRIVLALGRFTTPEGPVYTRPTLVVPGGLPRSPNWRIAPLGLFHGEGVKTGDRAFAEIYRLDSADDAAAQKAVPKALRKMVAGETGWTVEVVDGTAVAWREPGVGDALRHAATPPAKLIPQQLERLLAVAEALTADPKGK